MRILNILSIINVAVILIAAQTSQVNNYQNGSVLTADQLNAEFSNIYSTLNNLDNANLISSANIAPTKLSSTIDGDGISRQVDGSLDVAVDGVTVKIVSDELVVDDLPGSAIVNGGIASAQILDGSVGKADLAVKSTGATAGMGNVAVSAGTGASLLTYTSGTSGDLPNNLVNLTTNGSPISISLAPATDGTVSYIECEEATTDYCELELTRGGTTVTKIQFYSQGGKYRVIPGSFSWLDVQPAGTYEYKIKYNVPSATALRILNVRLIAYEL